METPIINLGIVAHVDAGKTTLTEQILWRCGAIRAPGRVDEGTAAADFLQVERDRGISVRSATISLRWRDVKLNLIDTPGHVDFAAEADRALRVLDVAIVVVCAVEWVQPHTKALWQALSSLGIPAIFFINKADRVGADIPGALSSIREELGVSPVPVHLAEGDRLLDKESLVQALCEGDDALLEAYIDGTIDRLSDAELLSHLSAQMQAGKLYPAISGAALRSQGIDQLLCALYALAPRAGGDPNGPVAGFVYGIAREEGRVAHVRLYSGALRNRDSVRNATRNTDEKVFQIREVRGGKGIDTGVLRAGDIGAVYGLGDVRVGDTLGDASLVPHAQGIAVPLLTARVLPRQQDQLPDLLAALEELSAEDPLLSSAWESGEAQVNVTGAIQLQVLSLLLRDRFALQVDFSPPTVIYKETPSAIAEGFEAYTMPKPCWAVIRFLIEPLPRGSGVVYQCAISNEKIHYRYQGQIEQTIPIALEQGPLGWAVTDLRVTLIDGGDHPIHTHPLDFALATPLAMMDGLMRAGTTLLEPMLRAFIDAPEECAGRILGDFQKMRGQFDAPTLRGGRFYLEGRLPVATSLDYPVRLASLSGGQAVLSTRFDGYQPCPIELGATAPHRGVDPRDRSKYILWKRSALS